MPTTDIQVSNLKINVLTEEQYEQIQNPSNTELYLVPEVVDIVPTEDSTNTITSGAVYDAIHDITAADVNAIPITEKGANGGVAELDSNGKVPSSQLPSYVDDVLEYASQSVFPATGESGKIYIALDTNKTYRWSGSAYTEISESLALGETSSTAYRGDRGKTAYDHSQVTDGSNPHNTTFANIASKPTTISGYGITDAFDGNYNSLTNKPTLGTAAAKDVPSSGNASTTQVVMGDDSRLTDARTPTAHTHTTSEITDFPTLATVATSGSYNDLSNKPTIPSKISDLTDDSDFIKKSSTSGLVKNDGTIDTNTYLTQHQDISGKADKVSNATNGHLASLDSNGNLTDSGSKASDFLTQHQDISGKANKSEMSVVDGTGSDADKTTITLKTGTSATVLKSHQDISGKQDVINSSNKLSADYIVDGTTNKVVNVKPDWNAATGNAAEILNKPTIPAAQVNSDWNASSGVAQILNKPTIPSITLITWTNS